MSAIPRLVGPSPQSVAPFVEVLRAAGWDGPIIIDEPAEKPARRCLSCGHVLEAAS